MNLFKTHEFLASSLKRFRAALATKLESVTGLSKEAKESDAEFCQRAQKQLSRPRFNELAEEAANKVITFTLPKP